MAHEDNNETDKATGANETSTGPAYAIRVVGSENLELPTHPKTAKALREIAQELGSGPLRICIADPTNQY